MCPTLRNISTLAWVNCEIPLKFSRQPLEMYCCYRRRRRPSAKRVTAGNSASSNFYAIRRQNMSLSKI